jgi:hypothetical protein
MKSYQVLPESYEKILKIDLKNDKKLYVLINIFAILIAFLMTIIISGFIPLSSIYDNKLWLLFIRLGVLILGMALYLILHELTHGIVMKLFGTKKIKYGFTGNFAYAGSDDYYAKIPYIIIALAPVILWGIVLLLLCFTVPYNWLWIVCLIQTINISGAGGDFYVTFKFIRLPKDILIRDFGTSMTVYSKKAEKDLD